MNDPDGIVFTCTIQPPSSGTGGSGGGMGGSGGGTSGIGGGTSGIGGGTSGSGGGASECEGCIESQCMSEAQACGTNGQCAALLNCLMECEDDACESGCESTYSEGVAPLNAYLECVFTKCESACSG